MAFHSVRDYVLLLTLSLIWGGSFAVIKIAVATVTPLTIAAGRIAIAFILLYALARAAGEVLPALRDAAGRASWGHFLAVGMLGNGIPFTLVSWGEIEVSASLAAILIGVMPVFTVVFAHLTAIERIDGPRRLIGVGAGLAGLVVLMGPAALGRLGGEAVLAQLAVAGAAASYAATAVYARRLTLRMPTLTLAAGTMGASAAVMVPAALLVDAPWRLAPSAGAVASVAALGVFATALASIVYFRLLASAGPTFSSMINYLIPAFGAVIGVAWLGEAVGPRELVALALILGAIALVRNPMTRGPAGRPGRPDDRKNRVAGE